MKLFSNGLQFCKSILYATSCMMLYACTPVSPGETALNRFTSTFSKEIEKEYGFKTYGVGASFPVKIEDIDLWFVANYPADIDQARKIVYPRKFKSLTLELE